MVQDYAPADCVAAFRDSHALSVGITKYERQAEINRALGEILHAHSDAARLMRTLRDVGYPESNLCCPCDEEATKDKIKRELQDLSESQVRRDLVVFFWAGHGVYDDASGQNYLLPYNADLNDLDQSAIAVQKLVRWVSFVEARHVAVFLDACYSKPPLLPDSSFRQLELKPLKACLVTPNWAFVGAAANEALETDREALESAEDEGGILSTCLCKGLRGEGGSGEDGTVDVFILLTYLQRAVPQRACEALRGGGIQRSNPQRPFVFAITGDTVPIGLDVPKYLVHRVLQNGDLPEPVREFAIKAIHKQWSGGHK